MVFSPNLLTFFFPYCWASSYYWAFLPKWATTISLFYFGYFTHIWHMCNIMTLRTYIIWFWIDNLIWDSIQWRSHTHRSPPQNFKKLIYSMYIIYILKNVACKNWSWPPQILSYFNGTLKRKRNYIKII